MCFKTNLGKPEGWNLLLYEFPAEGGVGNPDTLQVKILVRVLIQIVRDVWDVYTSMLASRSSNDIEVETHSSQHTRYVMVSHMSCTSASYAYALATDEEVAALQLAENFQELLHESSDLGRELIVIADARTALRETGLREEVQYQTARL